MATTTDRLPPLESGDRLTREEFHRRYCARPDIRKAELVQGVVYVASPTRHTVHGRPHGLIVGWLTAYAAMAPDLDLSDNATVVLGRDSEVQPDACLFWTEGGGVRITDEGYLEGSPELIVEIAASSASYDLHDKMEAYRRAGVQEYVVWQVLEGRIDWFRLRDGAYVPLAPDARGIAASEVFPGLRLNVPAMLAGDRAGVLSGTAAARRGTSRRRKATDA